MNTTTTLKKLSEQLQIDYYQLEKYIKYLNKEVIIIDKIKCINSDDVELITKFVNTYSRTEITYIMLHDIKPFFNGILMLNLRKKYNLNDKQFITKIENIPLDYKYVYSDDECKRFDEFMNENEKLNRAELRDLKYIKEGWIPLRDVIKEFSEKYDFCKNTAKSMLKKWNIEIYKPSHQLSFLSKENKNKFEECLKSYRTSDERKVAFQTETCMKKYGVENPSQSDSARKKISIKSTENANERLEKTRNTNLELYGVENPFQLSFLIDSNKQKYNNAIKEIHKLNGIMTKELAQMFNKDVTTIVKIMDKLKITQIYDNFYYYINDCDFNKMMDYFNENKYQSKSHSEKEIVDFIKSICDYEVIENSKKIISPMELDIYIPSKKVAIEYDGLYWHSDKYKNKNYHLNKTIACEEKGIDLIHVFEDDWLERKEICKSIISSRLGIYKEKYMARKCNLIEISKEKAESFFNKNHIQGFTRGTKYFALINNNVILQAIIMTEKGWHDGNVELTRMVTKLNTQVVGGFSKLVNYAYNYFNHKPITSYINRSLFNGKGYINSGFEIIKKNPPSYWWVNHDKRIHKSHFRRNKIQTKYKNGELHYWNENETEFQNMEKNGYYKIYDCGTVKVVYK